MYGIGNNYSNYSNYNFYSSMFSNQQKNNPWSNMVPNYAQINYSLLQKYSENNYSYVQDKLDAITKDEAASKSFYAEFNSTFSGLKQASSSLKSFSNDSVFRPMGYGSTDSSVASVKKDSFTDSIKPIKLDVKQEAKAQSYITADVKSSGNTLGGKSSLSITDDNGKKTVMNFAFASTGDNKSYLSKIASTVNDKKLGITASVTEKDGKSTLSFVSDKTGTDSSFKVDFTGDNAAKFEVKEKQSAQDAKYSVDDGAEQTSQSNDIDLADGKLTVTLKGTGKTEISKETVDSSKTVDAVKKFAESYNKALSFLSKNSDKSTAIDSLAYGFSSTRFQSGSLSKVGIVVDSMGALSVDEAKLTKSLKDNPKDVEKVLGGANGLASSTYGKTVNAMNNSRKLYPQSPAVSYPNFMYGRDSGYINSYTNGMFFNSMI